MANEAPNYLYKKLQHPHPSHQDSNGGPPMDRPSLLMSECYLIYIDSEGLIFIGSKEPSIPKPTYICKSANAWWVLLAIYSILFQLILYP